MKGTLPPGVKAEYKSPTNIVWVLGRTYSTGTPTDYAAVNAIQAQYKLTRSPCCTATVPTRPER